MIRAFTAAMFLCVAATAQACWPSDPTTNVITSGTMSPGVGAPACSGLNVEKPWVISVYPPIIGTPFSIYCYDDTVARTCSFGGPSRVATLACASVVCFTLTSLSQDTVDVAGSITNNPDIVMLNNAAVTLMSPYFPPFFGLFWDGAGFVIPNNTELIGTHIYSQVLEAYTASNVTRWVASDINDSTVQ